MKLKILCSEDNAGLEDAFNVWFDGFKIIKTKELYADGQMWMFIYYEG